MKYICVNDKGYGGFFTKGKIYKMDGEGRFIADDGQAHSIDRPFIESDFALIQGLEDPQLTLRDQFAMAAIPLLLQRSPESLAKDAYEFADAMLAEREKEK